MLTIHRQSGQEPSTWSANDRLPDDTLWLDLLNPSDDERRMVETQLDAALPQRDEIGGLGFSRRRHDDDHAIGLRAHLYPDDAQESDTALAILVTRDRLATLRYASSRPLDEAATSLRKNEGAQDGPGMLVMLLEAIVNDVAEQMQRIALDVAGLSDDVFTPARERSKVLRAKLLRIGKLEGRLARFRTSLLGIGRAVHYVEHQPPQWFRDGDSGCIKVVANDLKTLDQFDEQLTGKLQFLQDAVLGFISTDQNSVMKLMTVASVVTVPPVILAGIWGMNFKHMPELDKIWGYPMALGALAVSIAVPLAWFGARGWLSRD